MVTPLLGPSGHEPAVEFLQKTGQAHTVESVSIYTCTCTFMSFTCYTCVQQLDSSQFYIHCLCTYILTFECATW